MGGHLSDELHEDDNNLRNIKQHERINGGEKPYMNDLLFWTKNQPQTGQIALRPEVSTKGSRMQFSIKA